MITTLNDLESALTVDLSIAGGALVEARLELARKDSPGNRATLAEARARIDALLDMYLAADACRR